MLGRGVGLFEFVAACASPHPTGDNVVDLVTEHTLRFAFCGQFKMARTLAQAHPRYFDDRFRDSLESLADLWAEYAEAFAVADRIDHFLAVLEADGRALGLARGCRDELDVLLVLADLCEDIDRPLAAREARQLHALAVSISSQFSADH